MRILFATSARLGPLLAFADAFRRAGHQVLLAGPDEAEAAEAGLRFWPVAAPAQAALGGMLSAIEQWHPDVVVRASGELASAVAAERRGVPCVQVEDALTFGPSAAAAERRAAAALRFAPRAREPRLTLAPASLEAPGSARPVYRYRDPASAWAPPLWCAWADRAVPLVFVTFGREVPSATRGRYPGLYREVLAALVALPVRVLIGTGGRDPALLGRLPPAVRAQRWAAPAAGLRDAAVMVAHGGAGSTLAALAAGVPTAFLPQFGDQPVHAGRIAALGAGIALDGVAGLGEAVLRLLNERSFAGRARRLAGEIQALPPVDAALELLMGLADARTAA